MIDSFLKPLVPVRFRRPLNVLYFFGFKYICPICNHHLRKFLAGGPNFPALKEKEVVGGCYCLTQHCPICKVMNRERLVWLFLLHKTNIFQKRQKILHFAPERTLANRLRRQSGADYTSADLNAEHVMVKVDISNIQFPDNSFDVVIANHVLEHVADDRKAMRELYRILKPSGWAILQVPISLMLEKTYEDFSITTDTGREQAFGQYDHVRIYARDYKDRLERSGFKVNVFQWTAEIENFGTKQNIYGLDEKEAVYHVTKPN